MDKSDSNGDANAQFEGAFGGMRVIDLGVVYLSDGLQHKVLRWIPGARHGTTVCRLEFEPVGIHADPNGLLFVVDSANHIVLKYPTGTTTGVIVAGGNGAGAESHQLNWPMHVASDGAGALYVSEITNHRVSKWGPAPATSTSLQ